ncbi:cobalamin-binding protein [Paucihalobacter ruber]|uniref:Cobalamin-binding protein n=1 Tax=Paucihalobacter ruber TaxID=2567861 RepID=A0A506PPI4_9FLAO|nr:helical backbone metal receptor [Paucihalobacter ruber]TPV35479.1 cobalamin-binding protein [Paucihalobacter ruber]
MKNQSNEKQSKNIPSRIISLVPSQTELLVDLGLQSSLVGITKFCVHPKNLRKEVTVVGGTKQVHFEKIKALQPDMILCNKEENTLEMVLELEKIARVEVSDVNTFDDALQLIKFYGELFDTTPSANKLIEQILANRTKFQVKLTQIQRKKAAYFIWQQPYMVVANNTFINAMLEEAGFDNVFKFRSRYPEIELTDKDLQQAEVILLSSEPFPFKKNHLEQFKNLFPEKDVIIADGEMFSWYGSRLFKCFDYFIQLIFA